MERHKAGSRGLPLGFHTPRQIEDGWMLAAVDLGLLVWRRTLAGDGWNSGVEVTRNMNDQQQQFTGFYEALIETSIETLRTYVPKDGPYWGAFSGGKDSVVIKEIARLAGVPVEWYYNVTTLDPPELVRFIRREHPDVEFNRPAKTFVQWIATKGLPTRRARWCCDKLKESASPVGRRVILGVRAAESPRRAANWQTFTLNTVTKEYVVSPIIRWRDDDVWRFIRERELPYCELYDRGRRRLGCILCPMAGAKDRQRDADTYPHMTQQVYRAAKARWESRKVAGANGRSYSEFPDFDAFWEWWLKNEPLPGKADECQGQLEFWS